VSLIFDVTSVYDRVLKSSMLVSCWGMKRYSKLREGKKNVIETEKKHKEI
jgi:hypothetical protein